MGSSVSIFNDTKVPVNVWFELLGGGPFIDGWSEKLLEPGA